MQTNQILLYAVVFIVVFGGFIVANFLINMPKRPKEDLGKKNLPTLYRLSWSILTVFVLSIGNTLSRIQSDRTRKLKNQLLLANINMPVEYVYAAELLYSVVMFVLPLLFLLKSEKTGVIFFFALICGFVGLIYPSMEIASRAEKRQTAILRSLPFAIDLIGAAMRAGLDFNAAIRYYVTSDKNSNPLVLEFGIMLRQLELGKTRVQALEAVAARIQLDEFNSFCAAVAHGTEVGASIVDTMKIQAEEMRRARFNLAERKAARAPSIMIFPIALFIMPAVFIVIGVPVYLKLQSSGMGGLM